MKNKHEKSESGYFEKREKNMERHLSKELGINLEKKEKNDKGCKCKGKCKCKGNES
jgi:hypothetical protein